MTKMKSKKMTKSTFAIIIMGIVMVAMLAFGGTFAYFTATATKATGSVTTGTVKLENKTGATITRTSTDDIVPGAYLYGTADAYQEIELTNLSDVATYVFAKFTAEAKSGSAAVTINIDGNPSVLKTTVKAEEGKWTKLEGVDGVYYLALDAKAAADTFGFKVQFDERVQANLAQGSDEVNNVSSATIMGLAINVSVEFASIQQLTFGTVSAAYEAAFKTVATNNGVRA